ncbi:MAG: DMT family transporter [Pseudomonadota bacterium]
MKRSHALGLLAATAVLWSLGGLLIKLVVWPPLAIAGFRSAIAALVLWILCRPVRLTFSRYQWGGAIAYAGTVMLFVTATKMTTAANAILLQYTAPVYVAAFAYPFLKERTTKLDWFAILLALSGMLLFFRDRISVSGAWGNLWAIISALTFAWLTLFLRKLKGPETFGAVLLGNVITVVLCSPFMLQVQKPDAVSLFSILGLGVFQLGLSYYLYAKAIQHVRALEAMMVQFIEPILNPIWVLIFVGERPGAFAIVGGIMILTAVAMRTMRGLSKSRALA